MLSAVDGGKHPICFSQCPTNLFLFQSTHPSGVRPQWHGRYHRRQLISIHAPQWGATRKPRRGNPILGHFNPRTPVGCDHVERTLDLGRAISIHAPQWGATIQRVHVNLPLAISIHAPQWGATVINYGWPGHNIFQSTHPSGVRPSRNQHPWESRRYFNPRTPVGCDDMHIHVAPYFLYTLSSPRQSLRIATPSSQRKHTTKQKSGPAAKRRDHFMHSTRPCTTHQARSVRHGITPWRPPHPARHLPSLRRR